MAAEGDPRAPPAAPATILVTRADGDELLRLALADPRRALEVASAWLESGVDDRAASQALQARAIVHRDAGDIRLALTELREARGRARRTGDEQRVADVSATLGAALAMAGHTRRGLDELSAAADVAHGELLARVRMRRAHVLALAGRNVEALTELRLAVSGSRRAGDDVWVARALMNRALVHIAMGDVAAAEADVLEAERIFVAVGQHREAVQALHNRGSIAALTGDLPLALRLLDGADAGYRELGTSSPDLAVDRAQVLLSAGLPREAYEVIMTALDVPTVLPTKRPELELVAAGAALAAGDAETAEQAARGAARRFRVQERRWWVAHASLVAAEAAYARGRRDHRLLAVVRERAAELDDLRSDAAAGAHLLAGRLARGRRLHTAREHLTVAAQARRRGPALARATAWTAQAELARLDKNGRALLLAVDRGLDAIDEHRRTLGSAELRAVSASRGRELARLALIHTARHGTARSLLRWSERWRATALDMPRVRPSPDASLTGNLAALRAVARQLDEALGTGLPTGVLTRERDRLERAVRDAERRTRTTGNARAAGSTADVDATSRADFTVEALVAAVGDDAFVELVDVDGTLLALVVRAGRVRRCTVGPTEAAIRASEIAGFQLRRTARGRGDSLDRIATHLEAAVLGPVARMLGDGAVIVAPPARLTAVPWGLLPALAIRPTAAVPSAALWLRTRAASPPPAHDRVLVAGPGLPNGVAEVIALARRWRGAITLTGAAATVHATLSAMDGAWLAHVAAHGTFRADGPMFSSLALADGPLTVHDLLRLDRAPYRMLLPSCDSGVGAPVGAEELLGLVTALFATGSSGVLAASTVVNDEATVAVMLDLHRALDSGADLATALWSARLAAPDDLTRATAATLVALGT